MRNGVSIPIPFTLVHVTHDLHVEALEQLAGNRTGGDARGGLPGTRALEDIGVCRCDRI